MQWKLKLRSGRQPTDTLGREGQVARGVGEAHSSKEASNERGAKGPQFQGNRTSGKRDEIGESLRTQTNLWKLQETLHEKAKGNPRYRFYALNDKLYGGEVLAEAWRISRGKAGTSGVDRVSFEEIEVRERVAEGRLGELAQADKGKRHGPDAERRV